MSEVLDRSSASTSPSTSTPGSVSTSTSAHEASPASSALASEGVPENAPAVAVTVEPMSAQHFGQRLAAHRQDIGLSQTEVAAQLRLHLRQVVALEAADFSGLPEVAFIRGYLRNYARILGLDEQPLLDDLHRRAQASLGESSTVPLSEDRSWMSTSSGSTLNLMREWLISRRRWLLGALAALLVVAVVAVIATRAPKPVVLSDTQSSTEASITETATTEPLVEAPIALVSEPAAVGVAAPEAEVVTKDGVPAATSTTAQTAQTTVQTSTAASTVGAATGPTQLRIVFKERSWAEVAQGNGRVVLSQVVEPGTRQFSGQPPYRVLIGNASGVNVQWRGRVVDLKTHTSFENVARLTLE